MGFWSFLFELVCNLGECPYSSYTRQLKQCNVGLVNCYDELDQCRTLNLEQEMRLNSTMIISPAVTKQLWSMADFWARFLLAGLYCGCSHWIFANIVLPFMVPLPSWELMRKRMSEYRVEKWVWSVSTLRRVFYWFSQLAVSTLGNIRKAVEKGFRTFQQQSNKVDVFLKNCVNHWKLPAIVPHSKAAIRRSKLEKLKELEKENKQRRQKLVYMVTEYKGQLRYIRQFEQDRSKACANAAELMDALTEDSRIQDEKAIFCRSIDHVQDKDAFKLNYDKWCSNSNNIQKAADEYARITRTLHHYVTYTEYSRKHYAEVLEEAREAEKRENELRDEVKRMDAEKSDDVEEISQKEQLDMARLQCEELSKQVESLKQRDVVRHRILLKVYMTRTGKEAQLQKEHMEELAHADKKYHSMIKDEKREYADKLKEGLKLINLYKTEMDTLESDRATEESINYQVTVEQLPENTFCKYNSYEHFLRITQLLKELASRNREQSQKTEDVQEDDVKEKETRKRLQDDINVEVINYAMWIAKGREFARKNAEWEREEMQRLEILKKWEEEELTRLAFMKKLEERERMEEAEGIEKLEKGESVEKMQDANLLDKEETVKEKEDTEELEKGKSGQKEDKYGVIANEDDELYRSEYEDKQSCTNTTTTDSPKSPMTSEDDVSEWSVLNDSGSE